MTSERPYLSVVVCTRNDDHGGGLLERTQVFMDSFLQQCEKYQIESELIFVEWNPPEDRPTLKDILRLPKNAGICRVRIIQVPKQVHMKLKKSVVLPFFQMIAKNVGIRVARGRFILATNVDIIFSDSLMAFIGRKNLSPGNLYRTDRYDIPPKIEGETLDQKLAFCLNNSVRVCRIDGTYNFETCELSRIYPRKNIRVPDYLVGFVGMAQSAYLDLRRFQRKQAKTNSKAATQSIQSTFGIYQFANRIYSILKQTRMPRHKGELESVFTGLNSIMTTAIREYLTQSSSFIIMLSTPPVRLHTNACGDFTLMAREDWFRIRGYAEFELFSLHIDSLLVYSAYFAGLQEICLADPIFHMDHTLGWAHAEKNPDRYLQELDRRGVPYLNYEDFLSLVATMAHSKNVTFNRKNWGLVNEQLSEISVSSIGNSSQGAGQALVQMVGH